MPDEPRVLHTRAGSYVPIADAVARTGRSKDHFHRAVKRGAIAHRRQTSETGRTVVLVWLDDDDGPLGDLPSDSRAIRATRDAPPSSIVRSTWQEERLTAIEQLLSTVGALGDKLAAASERAGRAEAERDALERDRDVVLAERDRALAELASRSRALLDARRDRPWWRFW